MPQPFSRRQFVQSAAALAASAPLLSRAAPATTLKGRFYKTLKIGMVGVKGSLTDKFKAAKAAGFAGIEMNAPGMKVEETKKAIAESGDCVLLAPACASFDMYEKFEKRGEHFMQLVRELQHD